LDPQPWAGWYRLGLMRWAPHHGSWGRTLTWPLGLYGVSVSAFGGGSESWLVLDKKCRFFYTRCWRVCTAGALKIVFSVIFLFKICMFYFKKCFASLFDKTEQ
jgi:hypothetical protein